MSASYRIFDLTLKHKENVSPSLLRCVFTGPEVQRMKLEAPDQRIKLLFPVAEGRARSWRIATIGTVTTWRYRKSNGP
ncbi:Siderophore-interacting FAD-binding domain [Serratia fonticola]|uniref:Siderophore-interacting FAD-binding domain n=1 Tax=Serratia fonticola TaxID=47917 RepID=A0A4U9VL74_SERFO|nr:Siderophore-interacting FAD-binding domain [Serratia fonticola]